VAAKHHLETCAPPLVRPHNENAIKARPHMSFILKERFNLSTKHGVHRMSRIAIVANWKILLVQRNEDELAKIFNFKL
jgi:hypothetical protein